MPADMIDPREAKEKKGLLASKASSSSSKAKSKAKAKASVRVDVNTASEKELQQLRGVGPKKAKAIVAYRKKNGKFKSTDDLLKVKGMGGAIISKNLDQLTLPKGKVSLKTKAKTGIKLGSSK